MKPDTSEQEISRRTRRSVLVGGAGALVGAAVLGWLGNRREDRGQPWPLRRVLETNEEIARDYFKPSRLAAQFSRDQARMPRANGLIGLEQPAELGNWKVRVEGMETGAAEVTLEEIRSLPPAEMTTEIKCIEGWSEIVHWRGTRFSDFARRFSPPEETPDSYVGMETPDGLYYVGLDWASAIHPQTLLCWEMNGQPLEQKHGAPLRLVIPVKYGIKNIKRIGRVVYQSRRPADYWAESGYDWFAGL